MTREYIQYGCGWSAPEHWRNFDASPTLRFERVPIIGQIYTRNGTRFPQNVEVGNIVTGLPIPENSCNGVYCSHILEHLSLEDFKQALKNTNKILKQNGYFRLVVPDLEYSVNNYINNPSSSAASTFIRETFLGREKINRSFKGFIQEWLGNSPHLWMWDYKSLAQELQHAGFTNIRRAAYGDSADKMFQEVEEEERWTNCLGIECRKA